MSHCAVHSINLTTGIISYFEINIAIWRKICNSKEYTKRSPVICAFYPISSCLKTRTLSQFSVSRIIKYLAVTIFSESAFVILKYHRHIIRHGETFTARRTLKSCCTEVQQLFSRNHLFKCMVSTPHQSKEVVFRP